MIVKTRSSSLLVSAILSTNLLRMFSSPAHSFRTVTVRTFSRRAVVYRLGAFAVYGASGRTRQPKVLGLLYQRGRSGRDRQEDGVVSPRIDAELNRDARQRYPVPISLANRPGSPSQVMRACSRT